MKEAEKSEGIKKLQVNRKIFLSLSGIKTATKLTKEENAVVNYLESFFKDARIKLDLQKWRVHYVPHMERSLMEKIRDKGILGAIKTFAKKDSSDIPIDLLVALDNIIGSKKFFKFVLQRKGGLVPTMNIRNIVNEYSALFETKMALDKILPEAQAAQQLLLKDRSRLWMMKYLQNLKGRGMDFNWKNGKLGWMFKTADRVVDYGYIRLLAGNWGSALKNIVGGETNSFV